MYDFYHARFEPRRATIVLLLRAVTKRRQSQQKSSFSKPTRDTMTTHSAQMVWTANGTNWYQVRLFLPRRVHDVAKIPLADPISAAGKGHVRVENPAAWNLSGGYPLNENAQPAAEEYTMSLFHQLHCLVSASPYMNSPAQLC